MPWFLIIIALVGLGLYSSSRRTKPASIALIGDSLAVGLRSPLEQLAALDNVEFHSDVRGGTNAAQWLFNGWTTRLLEKYRPKILLISLGTNDSAVPGNAPKFIERAKGLVELAGEYGTKVIWLMPPDMPWSVDIVERGISESGGGAIMPPTGMQRSSDKIHSTVKGYGMWAEHIWRQL